VPLSSYQSGLEKFGVLMRNIALCLCAAVLIIAFIISLKMFQPVSDLIEVLDNPVSGRKRSRKSDEVEYVTERIISTMDSNQMIKRELEERLEALKKMEAVALGAQINHHFLYNTLDHIKWKAFRDCKDKSIVTMITRLSDLYRICAETDTHLVSIADELEYAKIYLDILEKRYKDKFQVNWNIDPDTLASKIIKLCLQPLIENAYYHGIKPKRLCGVIDITVKAMNNCIQINVTDNGIGISAEKLNEISRSFLHPKIHDAGHIGIENVNARIKLIMGEDYGLTLYSSENGTTASIRIPKHL
jgi:two-component system sensor histidine kinase YesM